MHGRLKSAQLRDSKSLAALERRAVQVFCCSVVVLVCGGLVVAVSVLGQAVLVMLFLPSARIMLMCDQTLTLNLLFVFHLVVYTDSIEKPINQLVISSMPLTPTLPGVFFPLYLVVCVF